MGCEGHSCRLTKGLEGTINSLEIAPWEDAADPPA